ncbi:MAG: hypothetical protein KC636_00515, partial [Myxococcales bacterium]|nr:hypothetical protein [Myxococcales bacterium]
GLATPLVKLNYNFGTVGIELHPGNSIIYACSDNAVLFTVDPDLGLVTPVGPKFQSGSCTNLAAPYKPVLCNGQPL